jgi:hypothetical protein
MPSWLSLVSSRTTCLLKSSLDFFTQQDRVHDKFLVFKAAEELRIVSNPRKGERPHRVFGAAGKDEFTLETASAISAHYTAPVIFNAFISYRQGIVHTKAHSPSASNRNAL